MSKVKTNPIIEGLSGRLGDLVFRQVQGRTVMSKAPIQVGEPSEKQLAARERFKQATIFANGQMRNPVAKAVYDKIAKSKGLGSPVAAAVQDFFDVPQVGDVILTEYKGEIGNAIYAYVSDVFVENVKVEIYGSDGAEIETGTAEFDEATQVWKFVAQVAGPNWAGGKVVITAVDRANNLTKKEVAFPS